MRAPRIVLLTTLVALALAQRSSAEVEVHLHQIESASAPATVLIRSEVPGEVNFSVLGKGFIRTSKLVESATASFKVPKPGIYQYKLAAGLEHSRGILTLDEGKVTQVLLTGEFTPSAPPPPEPVEESLSFEPHSAGVALIRNPFGPAFEKLSVDEKIRLVLESPQGQSLSATERIQLLGFLYNEKGVRAAEARQFEEAEQVLRKAYQNLPEQSAVRLNLAFAVAGNGNELRLSGNYGVGERKLLEALSLLAGSGDTHLEPQVRSALASLYVDQALGFPSTETRRREMLFKKALEHDPNHPGALFQIGQLAYQEYELDTALDYFERAYQGAPQAELGELIEKVRLEIDEAGDFVTQDRGFFRISFEGREVAHVAKETRKLLEQAAREVGRKFGLRPKGTIPVVIYSGGQFSKITGLHSWAGGAYDGKIRLPLSDLTESDLISGGQYLAELVFHEYTHALLHNRTAPAKIPVWLHEGLAQMAAGQNPDNPLLRRQVMDSLASGRLPMPSKLVGEFAGISDSAIAAQVYLESFLFVRFLIEDKGGWPKARRLIEAIGDGESIEDAFSTAYRKSLVDLESEWVNG